MRPSRTLLALVALPAWLASAPAAACSCFPPEVRARTAQDALDSARVAVFGRVLDVGDGGSVRILVLQSFKGVPIGSTLEAAQGPAECAASSFVVGEEALVLSFADRVTACDKHPPEHFLLEEFRLKAQRKAGP